MPAQVSFSKCVYYILHTFINTYEKGKVGGHCVHLKRSGIKIIGLALAGVAQWIECWSANPNVSDLIPSQDTCLGCGPGPQKGACKRQPHIDVSLPLYPSLLLALKINK